MKSLTTHLEHYLAVRRSFGYDLSFTERVLRRFTGFADAQGANHITVNLFLQWKEHYGTANNNTWAGRLSMVRVFATWLKGIEPANEIPKIGLISGRYQRSKPYIYTNKQINEIVSHAARLPSVYGLRGITCSTLLGLIAVTGLRINEALSLDEKDVNLDDAVIFIKQGKNGKSRFIPISPSTVSSLENYRVKLNLIYRCCSPAFFLFDKGQRPSDCSIRYNFALVCQLIGLRKKEFFYKHGQGARIHDLRHTFAVRTIIDWYRKGLNPDLEMLKLSTYLGHTKPEYTYWYIEAIPELLQLASERAEQSLRKKNLI